MSKGVLCACAPWLATIVVAIGLLPARADEPPVASFASASPAIIEGPEPTVSAPRFWARGEYLFWWVKGAPLPFPLLTLGDSAGQGALGQPGTRVLVGGSPLDFDPASGGRFALGAWLDDCERLGIEGNYFFLGRRATDRSFQSDGQGQPLSAIPFFQVGSGAGTNPLFTPTGAGETSTLVSAPGRFAGAAVFDLTTELQGAELNAVGRVYQSDNLTVELLGGFRYLNLREGFTLDTSSPSLPPMTDVFVTRDRFDAHNSFYGGQLGARVEYALGKASLGLAGKVALGTMQEKVSISGALITNDLNGFGPLQVFPGGYLALPSNIGSYHTGRFAVVPEATLTVGYWLTARLRASVGYNFLYLSEVARPGNQIDRAINPLQAPAITGNPPAPLVGAARPAFAFRQDDFWAQGLNFGLEFRF